MYHSRWRGQVVKSDDAAVRRRYKARFRKRRTVHPIGGTRDYGWGQAMRWGQGRPLGILLAATVALVLAGCASGQLQEEREARINVYPNNYRGELLAALHTYVSDPTNIRDAYVSDPAIRPIGRQNRYAACLRFDARNSDGRYVGSRDVLAVFADGRFDQFIDESTQLGNQANPTTILTELCGPAEYKRFAELEAMTR